jgi:hypothetical protein
VRKKLSDAEWEECRRLRAEGWSLGKLAEHYGVSKSSLSERFSRAGDHRTPEPHPNESKPEPFMEQVRELVRPGRPSTFRPEYSAMLVEYFAGYEPYREHEVRDRDGNLMRILLVPNRPPSLARFAASIGVHRELLRDWAYAKNEDGTFRNPEFHRSYLMAKTTLEALLFEGGVTGAYQSNMTKFALMNLLGWKESGQEEVDDAARLMPDTKALDAQFEQAMEEAERLYRECLPRVEQFGEEGGFEGDDE